MKRSLAFLSHDLEKISSIFYTGLKTFITKKTFSAQGGGEFSNQFSENFSANFNKRSMTKIGLPIVAME